MNDTAKTAWSHVRSFGAVIALLLPLVVTSLACAQISVDRVIFTFKKGAPPVHNVIVKNSSDDPLFVTVTPVIVNRAGFPDEKRQDAAELIGSPKRFPIGAQGERTVRLLLKKPLGDVEQVYRVTFAPEPGENLPQSADFIKKNKVNLRILTGVGILIFADPMEAHPKLTWTRTAKEIVFRNEGNIGVKLEDGRCCTKPEDASTCVNLPGKRLYLGNEYAVPTTCAGVITYRQKIQDEFSTLVIKPDSNHEEKVANEPE